MCSYDTVEVAREQGVQLSSGTNKVHTFFANIFCDMSFVLRVSYKSSYTRLWCAYGSYCKRYVCSECEYLAKDSLKKFNAPMASLDNIADKISQIAFDFDHDDSISGSSQAQTVDGKVMPIMDGPVEDTPDEVAIPIHVSGMFNMPSLDVCIVFWSWGNVR